MDYTCMTHGLYSADAPQAARPRAGERRFDLDPNQSVSVAAAPGTAVRCLRGRVWLTQEGHWQDHFLVAGESYVSLDNGKIVLNALDAASAASTYRIDPAPANARCDARLHLDAGVIARIEIEARRARAAEVARWFAALFGALSRIWRSIRGRRKAGDD
jgi:hypothetical protein